MNRISYLLAFILIAISGYSQDIYIVKDKDGHTNIRDRANKLIDKVSNGTPVWAFDDDTETLNRTYVEYTKGGISGYGYIHSSRLMRITSLEKIPISKETNYYLKFVDSKIQITVQTNPLNKDTIKEHLEYIKEYGIFLLDGSLIWGVDGTTPQMGYKSIQLTLNDEEIPFPSFAYKDLFEPNLNATHAYFDKNNNIIYLYSLNGDGAGGYFVIWVFKDGIYSDRTVFRGI